MPSFGDEISRLIPHLRRLARALVSDHSVQTADDLVQETVVLAMRAERVARGSNLTAWCFATLLRVHRHRRPASTSPRPTDTRDRTTGEARGAAAGTLTFLPKSIAKLDALALDDREVLLLASLVGMNYAQIAETLHLTHETVMTRLSRARRQLERPDTVSASRADPLGRPRQIPHLRLVK